MKASKIIIKNLFGITEQELDGSSVEITGGNGAGKTSILDAIKYALTNKSDRDYIVRTGEREGEIIVETDTGLSINRKKRTDKGDYKSVRSGGTEVPSPESFLQTLFTPLQLDPVKFLAMSKQEQNRTILDLIEFDWDMDWIAKQFGEIPPEVDYGQNILQVLHDIQSDDGYYFRQRQDVNRDIRNKKAFVEEIESGLPAGYDAAKWRDFSLSESYTAISEAEAKNSRVERAKAFIEAYHNKLRGIVANESIARAAIEKKYADRKAQIASEIEALRGKIATLEKEASMMGEAEEKEIALAQSKANEEKAKLSSDVGVAEQYAGMETIDVAPMRAEAEAAEKNIRLLREYDRMVGLRGDIEALKSESEEYTAKIEKARSLPGEILAEAKLPVDNLTVVDGIPLFNGLPISNLSEGEKLSLCVSVAAANPNALSLILLDGTEKLSDDNRSKLYASCKEKGLQFIATRTTDGDMIVTEL